MHGLFFFASVKISRKRASVSPWYAEDNSEPLITSTEDRVEATTARARWVFPVPGGPCSKIPFGGFRPA